MLMLHVFITIIFTLFIILSGLFSKIAQFERDSLIDSNIAQHTHFESILTGAGVMADSLSCNVHNAVREYVNEEGQTSLQEILRTDSANFSEILEKIKKSTVDASIGSGFTTAFVIFDNVDGNISHIVKSESKTEVAIIESYPQESLDNIFQEVQLMKEYNPQIPVGELAYWSILQLPDEPNVSLVYINVLADDKNQAYGIAGLSLKAEKLETISRWSQIQKEQVHFEVTNFFEDGSAEGIIKKEEPVENKVNWRNSNTSRNEGTSVTISRDGSIVGESQVSVLNKRIQYASEYLKGRDIDGSSASISIVQNEIVPYNSYGISKFWIRQNSLATDIRNTLILALLSAIAGSILIGGFIVKRFITPIERKINSTAILEEQTYEKTNIIEIDKLISEIDDTWADLVQASEVMTDAIQTTSSPVGMFLMDYEKETVFLSNKLFELLNLEKGKNNYYDLNMWNEVYCKLLDCREILTENVYIYEYESGKRKWLKVKYSINQGKSFGVIVDLTEDYLEKYRIGSEREIDTLTKLLKRTAFMKKASEILENKDGQLAIIIVIELGELQNINEVYGYDLGDIYIKHTAAVFYKFNNENGIVARVAENQFALCLYGYSEREDLLKILNEISTEMDKHSFVMPDGFKQKIDLSMGYSWYPKDSKDIDTLLCYANLVIYEMRVGRDDILKQFGMSSYLGNTEEVHKHQVLNKLIELNLFGYAFQPIVDAKTGEIYAYEALMRSKLKDLKSPMEISQLAKIQGSLVHIEKLTFFNVHKWIKQNLPKLNGSKIFINSIPKQRLSDSDIIELQENYGKYMRYVAHEYSINEEADDAILDIKVNLARNNYAEIAIDDFYNTPKSDELLRFVRPKFIKVRMSIVKGIDRDYKKAEQFRDIVEKARKLKIKVIALGVENHNELETVIALGADYVQGYYIKQPEYTLGPVTDVIKRTILRLYEKNR